MNLFKKLISVFVTNETATLTENKIVKKDGKFYVYSKDGSKKLGGPYATKEKAEKRLKQVEYFKKNNFFNVNLKAEVAKARHDTLEGKEHLVVPCVMMTEGVHQGSMGALYYPEEELSKVPDVWNGKPVVVYHPEMNGMSISACDPDIFNRQKIGTLFNTKWKDGKLKTECWLDINKLNEVDSRVIEAIENGEIMEVSTGLYTENEVTEGEWNGEKYIAIARNYKPDHLAILPDQIGACSVEDGAGLLRNQLSHMELRDQLHNKIQTMEGMDSWVIDVYNKYFIFENDGRMFHQEYEIIDNEVSLKSIKTEVEREVQYRMNNGTVIGNMSDNSNKEIIMDREVQVNELISNKDLPWTEEDREMLMNLSDEKFAMVENKKEEPEKKPEKKPDEETPEANKKVDEEVPAENKEMTFEELLSKAPAEYQDMVRSGLATHAASKKALIQKIVANERNIFTDEQLQAKGIDELEALVKLAQEPAITPEVPAPYFGGQAPVANTEQEEVLTPVALNFDSDKD